MGIADTSMTRRGAIAAIVAGSLTLAGCTQGQSQEQVKEEPVDPRENFDWENNYLPLGSVVKLRAIDLPDHVRFTICSRRPYTSGEGPYDYLGLWHPFGVTADVTGDGGGWDSEFIYFNTEDIEKVEFIGYIDELETRASEALEKGRGTDANCNELFTELGAAYYEIDIDKLAASSATEETTNE